MDTGSGSVRLRGLRGSLIVDTGSGDISVEGEPTGEWRLEAGSGSIALRLPKDAAFDLDAHTSSGSIHTDRPITVQGALKQNTLRGKMGGGGPLLYLRTSSGNIRLD